MREEAGRLAGLLQEAGVGADHTVAHCFGLEPVGVVAFWAIAETGARLALQHPDWTAYEHRVFREQVRPHFALVGRGVRKPRTDQLGDAMDVELSSTSPCMASLGLYRLEQHPERRPAADVVLPSSGTSGQPRLVWHDLDALLAHARVSNDRLGFDSECTWLATLSWAHIGGASVAIRTMVAEGGIAFAGPRFDAPAVARAIAEVGVTHVSLVPAMLVRLLEFGLEPPATLRAVLIGGAATPLRLVDRALAAGWPIALTYGLTEAGSQVCTAPPEDVRSGDRSSGLPLEGFDVRVSAEGSVEIRGRTLFRCYHGEALRPSDAWHDTGDLGRLRSDGRLEVLGRRSDRIVSGGDNVDPGFVEKTLAEHSGVSEVAVLGLPDDTYGEIVTAVVGGGTPSLLNELPTWVRGRLSGPRIPRRWEWLPRLPRTPTGKIDRQRVRDSFSAGPERPAHEGVTTQEEDTP